MNIIISRITNRLATGHIKLTDGSSKGKPGPTGIRGVLHDHNGIVMRFFSVSVGIKESNEVELLTIIKALELSSSKNEFFERNFIIESDYASVVNWMNKHPIRPWKYHDLFIWAFCYVDL